MNLQVPSAGSWQKGQMLRDLDSAKIDNRKPTFPDTPTQGVWVSAPVTIADHWSGGEDLRSGRAPNYFGCRSVPDFSYPRRTRYEVAF